MISVNHRGYQGISRGNTMVIKDWNGKTVAHTMNWAGKDSGRFKESLLRRCIDDYIRLEPFLRNEVE